MASCRQSCEEPGWGSTGHLGGGGELAGEPHLGYDHGPVSGQCTRFGVKGGNGDGVFRIPESPKGVWNSCLEFQGVLYMLQSRHSCCGRQHGRATSPVITFNRLPLAHSRPQHLLSFGLTAL